MRDALLRLAVLSAGLAAPAAAQVPAPTALTARSVSDSRIDLTWAGTSNGKQTLHSATNPAFTGGVKRTLGADVRAYAHTGLPGSTTYWYRVKSNGNGGSPWSAPASGTTAPAGLAVQVLSSSSLEISWTPNPANTSVSGYTVRYGTAADFASSATEYHWAGDRTVARYVAAGLAPGTTYYAAVKAEGSPASVFSPSASVTLPGGIPISRVFFGQNAWMPEWIGLAHKWGDLELLLCGADYVPGGPCEPAEVHASGVQAMRYGGKSVDKNWDDAVSPGQYLTMVDNLRTNGIEPLLQVPYHDGAFAPAVAAGLVATVNGPPNSRGVKYWSVGNEPNDVYPGHATAAGIASYVRAYVPAMRAADPDIAIVGPDLSWLDLDIMEELMAPGGPNDICGSYTAADGTARPYLDVVAFHTYPFHDGNQTRSSMIAFPEGAFAQNLGALQALVTACNDAPSRTGVPPLRMAVTEINVEYRNAPDLGIGGLGAQSFLGGQFWAEVLGVGMRHGLELMTFWSVKEGNPQLGYIANDGTRLPSYYHFQMLAKNFRGHYLPGTALVDGGSSPNVKAFAARDVDQTVVMILNQEEERDLPYTVRLDGGAVAGPGALKVGVDAGLAREYTPPGGDPLPAQGTVLLVFDALGSLRERHVYDVTFGAAAPIVRPD
ncbi:MAG: fibronectin type III domain-containing protein [Vicinamibacteria bacterium]